MIKILSRAANSLELGQTTCMGIIDCSVGLLVAKCSYDGRQLSKGKSESPRIHVYVVYAHETIFVGKLPFCPAE